MKSNGPNNNAFVTDKMEAVVFDGKTLSLKYQKDYPMPVISNDDEVIVKIEYSGICGTDLHIIQVGIKWELPKHSMRTVFPELIKT